MTEDASFLELAARLRAGDDAAAGLIVERFTRRLVALARRHLDTVISRKVDPEDVVQSVYRSFFRRQRAGEFDLDSWTDLWALLTVITVRKCANQAAHVRAERRHPGREVPPRPAGPDDSWAGREALDRGPTPLEAAALADTVEQLLRGLDPADRPIIELSLQGYTVEEISTRLGRAERTVWRLRQRARARLRRLCDEPAGG